jgi:sporulation protein YlmC with PRC-barrel domain
MLAHRMGAFPRLVALLASICFAGVAVAQEPPASPGPQPEAQGAPPAAAPQSPEAAPAEGTAPQAGPPQGGAPTDAAPQAAPSQSVAPANAPVQAKTETPTIVLDSQDVQGILGKEALSRTGEKMGQIVDVILDRTGRIRAAIIDFGGFLGVGSRKIAVDWRAVHFVAGSKAIRIILDLTREDVVGSHEYKPNDQITVLEPKEPPAVQENAEPKPAPAVPQ